MKKNFQNIFEKKKILHISMKMVYMRLLSWVGMFGYVWSR